MRETHYNRERARNLRTQEIYRLRIIEGMDISGIIEKMGISRVGVYRALSIFERENPQQAALMKKQGKDISPEDYHKLLNELSKLKKDLAQERLRADFYE